MGKRGTGADCPGRWLRLAPPAAAARLLARNTRRSKYTPHTPHLLRFKIIDQMLHALFCAHHAHDTYYKYILD
eukprot:COSAG05_NODE_584_length_8527_cov_46.366279_1_plen_73_part_10